MADFLNVMFWGNRLVQWCTALAMVAGSFLLSRICSLVLSLVLKHFCSRTKIILDDMLVIILDRILTRVLILVGLAVALELLILPEEVQLWTQRIFRTIFILVCAWGSGQILDTIIINAGALQSPESPTDRAVPVNGSRLPVKATGLQPILRKLSKTLIWIIAIAFIFHTLGYNVSALLAGLGLGGAALALASKDTLANFFGSITVFVDRPFRLHDRIKIAGFDGYITEMGLRTSRLQTQENRTVIIPNSIFAANPIENVSAEPHTKVNQTLVIKRDSGFEKIEMGIAFLKTICSQTPGTNGVPVVGIVTVGGLSCQVSLVYYVAKNADYLETVNRVNMEILRRFDEAGINLG